MRNVKNAEPTALVSDHLHEIVLNAYEEIGYPREIVGSWAISENDVDDFVRLAVAVSPKRVLEVGTYVGVSTMLLALACPDAHIFTVDPDLPLETEMASARSQIQGVDHQVTTQAIGKRAAERLGVVDRISFVRGGFSVADTFSSVLGREGSHVEVIGPKLCAEQGPFDLIFIDGLHSEEAVAADLELAAAALTPDGVMILHDCIGYWGASVRSGVFRFLRRNTDFQFTHPRFSDVYKSVGVVRRRRGSSSLGHPVRKPLHKSELSSSLRAMIARMHAALVGHRPVLEIAFGEPVLEAEINPAKTRYAAASLMDVRTGKTVVAKLAADVFGGFEQMKDATVFSLDLLDFAGPELVASIFSRVATHAAPLVLAVTPPGEAGVAGPFSRPIAAVIDMAESIGLAVYSLPALDLEAERYVLLPEVRDLGLSSFLTFFVVVAPPGGYVDALGRNLVRLTPDAAAELEQLELQRVHLAAAYRRYYDERNLLLQSNTLAGELVRRVEGRIEAAETAYREQSRIADESLRERAALAARFAELAQGFQQFSLQRAQLEEQIQTKNAEAEALAQTIAEQTRRLETEQAQAQALTDQLIQEKARMSELSLIAIDAFETIDFIESTILSKMGLIPPEEGRVYTDALGDTDVSEVQHTAVELATFRDRGSSGMRDAVLGLQSEINALRVEKATALEALRQMRASTSWRLTSPFRLAVGAASELPRLPDRIRRRVLAHLRGRRLIALHAALNYKLSGTGLDAPVFDPERYQAVHGDVPAAEALRHYFLHGEEEGRRPSAKFDPVFYRAQYPDIASNKASPLLHFFKHGLHEGRSPCAELYPLDRLAREAGVSPLEYMARHSRA